MGTPRVPAGAVLLALAWAVALGLPLPAARALTAQPVGSAVAVDPYKWTGQVRTYYPDGSQARGSGAVVRHSRIVTSCAHLVFDLEVSGSPWLTQSRWFLAHNTNSTPPFSSGIPMAGYTRFDSYATSAMEDEANGYPSGTASPGTFHYDFIVFFAFQDTGGGGAGGWYSDGAAALRSAGNKLIVGYPANPNGGPNDNRMFQVGPFANAFSSISGRYMKPVGTVGGTSAGNSGGPVWVQTNGVWGQAGVLVSTNEGTVAVDNAVTTLMQSAIASASGGTSIPAVGSDDYGNTIGAASNLGLNATRNGYLEEAGDVDMFRIQVANYGDYRFTTTGSTDTRGILYDSSGNVVAADDNSGSGANFSLLRLLSPGTYYLGVQGQTSSVVGAYTAGCTVVALYYPEIGVLGNGAAISSGSTTTGAFNHTDFGQVSVAGGSVSRTFVIQNTGTAPLHLTGSPVVRIDGQDAAAFAIASPPPGQIATGGSAGFTVTFDPTVAGTNLARVVIANSDEDEETYTFAISGLGVGLPVDDHGDDRTAASALNMPGTITGTADAGGNADYFRFTLAARTGVIIQTRGSTDTLGLLYDSSGRLIAQDDDSGDAENFLISRGLNGGTYYVAVRGRDASVTGPYELEISSGPLFSGIELRSKSGLVIANGDAAPSAADGTHFGAIDLVGPYVERTFVIASMGDADLNLVGVPRVALSGAGAGQFLVRTQPASPVKAQRSASYVVRFDPSLPGLHEATIEIASDDPAQPSYTFGIAGQGTGPLDDHSGVRPEATLLPLGGTLAGTLERLGDIDWFTFTLADSRQVAITSSGGLNVKGTLTDGLGKSIFSHDNNSPADLQFTIRRILQPGTYFLGVRASGKLTGTYSVSLADDGAVLPDAVVTYGKTTIPSGWSAPSLPSGTDFGSVDAAAGYIAKIFTIKNLGQGTLELDGHPRAGLQGTGAAHFFVAAEPPAAVAPTRSATFVVWFDPAAPGVHEATVTISTNDPLENPYTFAVRGTGTGVADPETNTRSLNARPAVVGGATAGSLATPADQDWFSFTLAAAAHAQVFTTGTTDTAGTLYNGLGKKVASNDNSSDANFRMAATLTPGTYYVQVLVSRGSPPGPYQLHITASPAWPEIDVKGLRNVSIPSGSTNSNLIDGTYFGAAPYTGSGVRRDFTIWNTGPVPLDLTGTPRLEVSGPGAMFFTAAAQPPAVIAPQRSARVSLLFRPLTPGLYSATVTIRNGDQDEDVYTFDVLGEGIGHGSIDDHSNTPVNATPLLPGIPAAGRLQSGTDQDYFTFALPSGSNVVLESSGAADVFGSLLNSSRKTIATDDDSLDGTHFRMATVLPAGTYYMAVRGAAATVFGDYGVLLTTSPAFSSDLDGDSMATATLAKFGVPRAARLDFAGDEDWFRFVLASPTNTFLFTTGSTDTHGELYSNAGTRIISNQDDGDGANFLMFRTLSPGTYYLRVKGAQPGTIGNYSVHVAP